MALVERAMKFLNRAFLAVVLLLAMGLGGCTKKHGEAIVLEKEHIDAAQPTPTPSATSAKVAAADESPAPEDVKKDLAADEIVVDSYVMKKEVRGTGKDPRAYVDEQWLVKVALAKGGREFTVHTDRAHYNKVKVGDRIKVTYHQGKRTRTVWSARIED
jgi:hypothetical protein